MMNTAAVSENSRMLKIMYVSPKHVTNDICTQRKGHLLEKLGLPWQNLSFAWKIRVHSIEYSNTVQYDS